MTYCKGENRQPSNHLAAFQMRHYTHDEVTLSEQYLSQYSDDFLYPSHAHVSFALKLQL